MIEPLHISIMTDTIYTISLQTMEFQAEPRNFPIFAEFGANQAPLHM